GEQSLLMTVVLHFAPARATIFVFRKAIWPLVTGGFSMKVYDSTLSRIYTVLRLLPAAPRGTFSAGAVASPLRPPLLLAAAPGLHLITTVRNNGYLFVPAVRQLQ